MIYDLEDFFGEVRLISKSDVIQRGDTYMIKYFDIIGKAIKFEYQAESGVLIGIGEDNQDYVVRVQYNGYIVDHSPLERFNVL